MKHPLQERHKRTEGITLNDVLTRFNPYHGAADYDSLRGALAVNASYRAAFHDLFVAIMDNEHEDVRNWEESRWKRLVSFANDLNGFLQGLDQYYQQERLKTKK